MRVMVRGTIKNTNILYTETHNGTTYRFFNGKREISIQLVRTGNKTEYREVCMPETMSLEIRQNLLAIAKHFSHGKQ